MLVHYLETSKEKTSSSSSLKDYTEPVCNITNCNCILSLSLKVLTPTNIPLLALTDQQFCQYLSTKSGEDTQSLLHQLSLQIITLSNKLLLIDNTATLSTFFTYLRDNLLSNTQLDTPTSSSHNSSLSHDMSHDVTPPPPHILLINQAMTLLHLQACSSQYGNHCLLPKGMSPGQLFKAAATYLAKNDVKNETRQRPSQSMTTSTEPDFAHPLCPPSLEQIEPFFPGSLDSDTPTLTTPQSSSVATPTTTNYYNMADFQEFAHSLVNMRPLEEVELLIREQKLKQHQEEEDKQHLEEDSSVVDKTMSDVLLQQILDELKASPNSSNDQLFLSSSFENGSLPLDLNHTHSWDFSHTQSSGLGPSLELDPESEKLLHEISPYCDVLSTSHPSTSHDPLSHYISTLNNETGQMPHPLFNHHGNQWQPNDTTSYPLGLLSGTNEAGLEAPPPVAMVMEPSLDDMQFANSLLQHPAELNHTSDTPTGYRSPIPSSPSQTSISSLSTPGEYMEDAPLVAEICELLSESPTVQATDFSHLSLTNSQQKDLLEASRVIQNTLRRYNRPVSMVTLNEKDAALLIERSYKRYREVWAGFAAVGLFLLLDKKKA